MSLLVSTVCAGADDNVVTTSVEQQYQAASPGGKSALAVRFELKKDWHYYASEKTAPGQTNLKIYPSAKDYISFAEPIFPPSHIYFDQASGTKQEVFSDRFTVFLPFDVKQMPLKDGEKILAEIRVGIKGVLCSQTQCRIPDLGDLVTTVEITRDPPMGEPRFVLPAPAAKSGQSPNYSTWFALLLAFTAGLTLNIMPCVLPVIPLKLLSIIEQAKESRARCILSGLLFCAGILLFFAILAAANIILQVFYGVALQWGDQFRSPLFLSAMAMLLTVLAMFMFGILTVNVPSLIASRTPGKGLAGSVAMGLLTAILSTPCSFAILTAAFAWAQVQKWPIATLAIMTIGFGMAAPFLILTSMPSLLKHIPKTGRWTEIFKQTMGFVLLAVAIWLITALPAEQKDKVLYFGLVLAFCTWMWGGWVNLATPIVRRKIIRLTAAAIAAAAAWLLPVGGHGKIDWQDYEPQAIEEAVRNNRAVLIKFTADWCMTCMAVEKTTYSRKDVAELIKRKNILSIKADTTSSDSRATTDLKNLYNEPGVPVSILLVPGQVEPVKIRGLLITGELKHQLERLEDKTAGKP